MPEKFPMGGGTVLFLAAPMCECGWMGMAQPGINAQTILEVFADLAEHQVREGHRRKSG